MLKKTNRSDDDKVVKFKGYLNRVIYSKSNLLTQGDWGIVSWVVQDVVEGDPALDYRGNVTVVGTYETPIDPDKVYNILGKEVENEKYGKQYELMYYAEDVDLSQVSNQRGFLKQFLTELQIEEMYKVYPNPLAIIDSGDVEALKKVRGIGDYIANRILNSYEGLKDMSMVYVELDKYGLTSKFISKLADYYKSPQKILRVVKETPYDMVADIDGVGFATADAIALRGGYELTDIRRIKAFILWYLRDESENGNSFVYAGELMADLYNDLGSREVISVDVELADGTVVNNIAQAMKELQEEDQITVEEGEKKSQRRVYLTKMWRLERDIAYHLKRILEGHSEFYVDEDDFEAKIRASQEQQGFKFTKEQLDGIKLCTEKQVCLISGLAGTGKSSLVAGVLSVLDQYTFAQCALSGKAAARLQEVTGQEGYTIHRLLGFKGGTFQYNEDAQLPFDIYVLDEISLVGGDIFLSLLKAIPTGAKLIMLGDMGQLEAIGPLNLAADMFNSGDIPTVDLKEVHRQAQASGILTTAYTVREQKQLYKESDHEGVEVRGELQDMVIDTRVSKDEDRHDVVAYFDKYFNGELVNRDISKIQVISPVKERGDACVFNLNQDIQQLVNPPARNKAFVTITKKDKDKSFEIREGDKVMCVKNKYDTLDEDGGKMNAIFNGWTGIVKKIDHRGILVDFDLGDKPVIIEHRDINNELVLGYVSTLHKIQGSSADVIIGVIDYSTPPMMLTCQLVYTLLTRAKKRCILVAQTKALTTAISNNKVVEKRTFLPELLAIDIDSLRKSINGEKKLAEEAKLNRAKNSENYKTKVKMKLLGGLTASSSEELDSLPLSLPEYEDEDIDDWDEDRELWDQNFC